MENWKWQIKAQQINLTILKDRETYLLIIYVSYLKVTLIGQPYNHEILLCLHCEHINY